MDVGLSVDTITHICSLGTKRERRFDYYSFTMVSRELYNSHGNNKKPRSLEYNKYEEVAGIDYSLPPLRILQIFLSLNDVKEIDNYLFLNEHGLDYIKSSSFRLRRIAYYKYADAKATFLKEDALDNFNIFGQELLSEEREWIANINRELSFNELKCDFEYYELIELGIYLAEQNRPNMFMYVKEVLVDPEEKQLKQELIARKLYEYSMRM